MKAAMLSAVTVVLTRVSSLSVSYGLGISFAAQDGLYAFGHYVPHAVEVAVDGGLVEQEFAESLEGRSDGNHHVSHRHTDVAQHGRVGKVALQAAYGQFRREVVEYGVGDAEVALGIFEVDGVDLVGHGR